MNKDVMNKVSKQKGFTLIEIAIVLVIIGLLLGGVLKGQELINTARVRALNNSVDGITAAWFSFQDRYRSFPGDYTQATVNLPDPGGIVLNGDGNGLVGDNAGADSPSERANVWVHLQAAGYITGSFDGANVAVAQYNCPIATCPDNGFGSGMNLSYTTQSKGAPAANAHELITGGGIPVEVLAELDRKVDDGRPLTGAMQLGTSGTGWLAAASTACQRTDATAGEVYDVTINISSNCAAVFRNF
ncbi:MAG: prepilin-type N-terminal cleavage/methylation domain-containing protein [Gammaproteobacteria bacterium]|nr:MAG: prepilin-type N-terminal cleavage/methylation domain-containing protein [Gammaproteobacteria bacterium]